jgi:hypothetical protein
MSSLTQNFGLNIPDRGELPGTWDTLVNANWILLDTLIKDAYFNRSSVDEPVDASVGLTWYDISLLLLKVRAPSGWVNVVAHTHDGTIVGVPKINLATDILDDIAYKLPGHLVSTLNLDADLIDGKHLSELATELAGAGLSAVAGKIIMPDISALVTLIGAGSSVSLTKVTVDKSGKIINGSTPNTLFGAGITDAYTKTESGLNFALKKGEILKMFQVKDPVDGATDPDILDTTKCAISRFFADNKYAQLGHTHSTVDYTNVFHPKNGSETELLVAKMPDSDSSLFDNYLISRIYADSRYLRSVPSNTYLSLSGGTMTGELELSSAIAPISDSGATSKAYVISHVLNKIAELTAPKAGDEAQSFLIAKAPISPDPNWEKYALNKLRADEIYSQLEHTHANYVTSADLYAEVSTQVSGIIDTLTASSWSILAALDLIYDIPLPGTINDTLITVNSIDLGVLVSDIPASGYLKVTGHTTLYSYVYSDPTGAPGALTLTPGLEASIIGGEDATIYNAAGDTIITKNSYDVNSGSEYFIDTTNDIINLTLPITPVLGDTVEFVDVAGLFETNNLTILRNDEKIMGLAEDMIVSTNNTSLKLVYSNTVYGWRIVR